MYLFYASPQSVFGISAEISLSSYLSGQEQIRHVPSIAETGITVGTLQKQRIR